MTPFMDPECTTAFDVLPPIELLFDNKGESKCTDFMGPVPLSFIVNLNMRNVMGETEEWDKPEWDDNKEEWDKPATDEWKEEKPDMPDAEEWKEEKPDMPATDEWKEEKPEWDMPAEEW